MSFEGTRYECTDFADIDMERSDVFSSKKDLVLDIHIDPLRRYGCCAWLGRLSNTLALRSTPARGGAQKENMSFHSFTRQKSSISIIMLMINILKTTFKTT